MYARSSVLARYIFTSCAVIEFLINTIVISWCGCGGGVFWKKVFFFGIYVVKTPRKILNQRSVKMCGWESFPVWATLAVITGEDLRKQNGQQHHLPKEKNNIQGRTKTTRRRELKIKRLRKETDRETGICI